MQDEKVEMTLAEPGRERIMAQITDEPTLDLVRGIVRHRRDGEAQLQAMQERHERELEELQENLTIGHKQRFVELATALGLDLPDPQPPLVLDTEYLERLNVAFLVERELNPDCPVHGGGLAALLTGLAGGPPRQY